MLMLIYELARYNTNNGSNNTAIIEI